MARLADRDQTCLSSWLMLLVCEKCDSESEEDVWPSYEYPRPGTCYRLLVCIDAYMGAADISTNTPHRRAARRGEK